MIPPGPVRDRITCSPNARMKAGESKMAKTVLNRDETMAADPPVTLGKGAPTGFPGASKTRHRSLTQHRDGGPPRAPRASRACGYGGRGAASSVTRRGPCFFDFFDFLISDVKKIKATSACRAGAITASYPRARSHPLVSLPEFAILGEGVQGVFLLPTKAPQGHGAEGRTGTIEKTIKRQELLRCVLPSSLRYWRGPPLRNRNGSALRRTTGPSIRST